MLEAVAEFDDQVMEKYLNGQSLTEEEIRRVVRAGAIAMKVIPVLCGSAFKNKGVQQLLDGVVDFLPSLSIFRRSQHRSNTNKEIERRRRTASRLRARVRSCRILRGPLTYFPSLFRHHETGTRSSMSRRAEGSESDV